MAQTVFLHASELSYPAIIRPDNFFYLKVTGTKKARFTNNLAFLVEK